MTTVDSRAEKIRPMNDNEKRVAELTDSFEHYLRLMNDPNQYEQLLPSIPPDYNHSNYMHNQIPTNVCIVPN